VAEAFDAYELHVGLADIFAFIGEANRRFTKRAPWADAKALLADLTPEDRKATAARLGSSLAEQVYGLAIIARCLLPFLPSSAAKLHSRLGIPSPRLYRDPLIVTDVKAAPQAVLFPQRASA
jgi:methionyl-tRNA synthetase